MLCEAGLDSLFNNRLFEYRNDRYLRLIVRLVVENLRDRITQTIEISSAGVIQHHDQILFLWKAHNRGGETVDTATMSNDLHVIAVLLNRRIPDEPSVRVVVNKRFVHQRFRLCR